MNWFRKSAAGNFMWPGHGENSRFLKWMCDRVDGKAKGVETPIGIMPAPDELDISGLNVDPADMKELLNPNAAAFKNELPTVDDFFAKFGGHLPARMKAQLEKMKGWLG